MKIRNQSNLAKLEISLVYISFKPDVSDSARIIEYLKDF